VRSLLSSFLVTPPRPPRDLKNAQCQCFAFLTPRFCKNDLWGSSAQYSSAPTYFRWGVFFRETFDCSDRSFFNSTQEPLSDFFFFCGVFFSRPLPPPAGLFSLDFYVLFPVSRASLFFLEYSRPGFHLRPPSPQKSFRLKAILFFGSVFFSSGLPTVHTKRSSHHILFPRALVATSSVHFPFGTPFPRALFLVNTRSFFNTRTRATSVASPHARYIVLDAPPRQPDFRTHCLFCRRTSFPHSFLPVFFKKGEPLVLCPEMGDPFPFFRKVLFTAAAVRFFLAATGSLLVLAFVLVNQGPPSPFPIPFLGRGKNGLFKEGGLSARFD